MAPRPPSKSDSQTRDERISGRPTLVPSVGPEVHAQRVLREAEQKFEVPALEWAGAKWAAAEENRSQVPTIPPPSVQDTLSAPPRPGDSQRPTATDVGSLEMPGALSFVDGHQRESVSPASQGAASLLPESEGASTGANISISDLFAVGDFTGALTEAERRLVINPEDDEALRYLDECRRTLTRMYTARLAPLDRAVRLAVPQGEIRWLTLDHRAGFLISRMDGTCSVEDLLDMSGMSRLDALRILHELVGRGVVVVG